MKILHVIAGLAPEYGGTSKAGYELCCTLGRMGHNVALYTTNVSPEGELDVPTDRPVIADGLTIHYFPVGRPRKWAFSWPMAKALREDVKAFDIVNIHGIYSFPAAIAAYYCRKYGTPYLIRPHGSLDPFLRRKNRIRKVIYHFLIGKRALNGAAAIHYTTQEEMNLAHFALNILSPGVVVPLGIDLTEYAMLPRRGIFRSQFPEIGDAFLILFLGRLNFKKGLDLLAKSYGIVARQCQAVHLVIAGPDNEGYGQRVRQWLTDEGVLHRATFTGMLLGQDKLAALSDADVFVLPSYSENWGVAVVEAMACGLPVVISDQVNLWQEVAKAEAGLVIPCDPQKLSDALLQLQHDAELREKLGANGRRLAAKFSWNSAASQMLDVYEKYGHRV